MITRLVEDKAKALATSAELPAFVYDLTALREHAAEVKTALSVPGGPEIFYAAKANPDVPILQALAPYVDGIEVASGGELAHVRETLPDARLAFGGPGKTDRELELALELGVERIHVESPHELARLARIVDAAGQDVDVLLRVNLAGDRSGVALAMIGPFGMDPDLIETCREILTASPRVHLRGIHAHLASGLDASAMVRQSAEILDWGRSWLDKIGHEGPREFNVGGGMAVDYGSPNDRFDWKQYGQDVAALARPGETLRIEPGRSISVYSGWYITDVLDVKQAHGQWYAVVRGGTMHIRTPVTKQHNHPFVALKGSGGGPQVTDQAVTLVGQLCTPKDVFARDVSTESIAVGDLIAFSMAGAYAWNISHHDFLMHPKPTFHYLDA
ncbi:type III PLP-dependent enzyme [Actinomadura verrucosospora]|uniref:Orn/DAP/Arg decarboxylase 2 n=1 Tax=Actinomadura verrucosospora TaxID=46165 RepID=A0A7D3W2X2_ACTVE|nr:type III PLP-dependent enzyme [Actinomadura verrucosospora]QKG27294.1 Orn/DAP/Arg decarboxylase 2 [Actinomadura verrucosospora]